MPSCCCTATGKYAPEHLPAMLAPLLDGSADVVLGSRMINRADALRGKMPLYKWVGNQIPTFCQNKILGSGLAEFHTGYRAFRVGALASIPFQRNSNYFDFDTEILIQLMDTGQRFREIPVPTFYGDEVSRVNGLKYAALIMRTSILSRIMKLGIFFDPRFDYENANTRYAPKLGYPSSHEYALNRVRPDSTVLRHRLPPWGRHAESWARKGVRTISLDRQIDASTRASSYKAIETDIEAFEFSGHQPDRHHSAARCHRTSGLARTVPAARERTLLRGCTGDGDHDGQRRLLSDPSVHGLRSVQLWQARRPRSDAHPAVHVLLAAPAARAERLRRGRSGGTSRAVSAGAGRWLARPRRSSASTAC